MQRKGPRPVVYVCPTCANTYIPPKGLEDGSVYCTGKHKTTEMVPRPLATD